MVITSALLYTPQGALVKHPINIFSEYHQSDKYITDTLHYKKHVPVRLLHDEDKAVLLPLPLGTFHTERWETVLTDKMGFFKIDKKYKYSSAPDNMHRSTSVKITSDTVTVYSQDMTKVLAQHKRMYGDHPTPSIDWSAYIVLISRRPRCLFNTGLCDILPKDMEDFLLKCDLSERYLFLRLLASLTRQKGVQEAISTMQSKTEGTYTYDILRNIYIQLFPKEMEEMILDIGEEETIPDMDEQLTQNLARLHRGYGLA